MTSAFNIILNPNSNFRNVTYCAEDIYIMFDYSNYKCIRCTLIQNKIGKMRNIDIIDLPTELQELNLPLPFQTSLTIRDILQQGFTEPHAKQLLHDYNKFLEHIVM